MALGIVASLAFLGVLVLTTVTPRSVNLRNFHLTRVKLDPPSLQPNERIIQVSPGRDSVTIYSSDTDLFDLYSPDQAFLLRAYDYSGKLLASVSPPRREVPEQDIGIAFLDGIGFCYYNQLFGPDQPDNARLVCVAPDGTLGFSKELPYAVCRGVFDADTQCFVLLEAATFSTVYGCKLDSEGSVEDLPSIPFSGRPNGTSDISTVFWQRYVAYLRDESLVFIDPAVWEIVDDKAAREKLRASVEGLVGRWFGWLFGARDGLAVGFRTFSGLRPEGIDKLGISAAGHVRWYRQFDRESPGICYRLYRLAGLPTPTDLEYTLPTATSSGPIVLYDGIAHELLLIEPK